MPWHNRERARYDDDYNSHKYLPDKCIDTWLAHVNDILNQPGGKNMVMLDVGCGPGYSLYFAKEKGLKLYGIDITSNTIDSWEKYNVKDRAIVAYSDGIPFKDNTFDFITCLDVMEHVPEEGVVPSFLEMNRVIKDNGFIHFLIALKVAKFKMSDGSEPHITLKPTDWWVGKIKDCNFQLTQNYKRSTYKKEDRYDGDGFYELSVVARRKQ